MTNEYAHFRDNGRDNADSYLVAESVVRGLPGAPSGADRLRFADEIMVVRDAFLADHRDAAEMAASLIEHLADAHLVTWWNHREELSSIRRLARDPDVAVHAYNDGLWSTLAKRIAGKRIGRAR